MAVRILHGHAVDVLRELPAGSVHCVVTSPPYFKLRRYGTPPQTWSDGWCGELGWEPTPEAYIAHLVEVFAGVWRVLRDDGTCWVNLGDSYWTNPGGQNGSTGGVSAKAIEANRQAGRQQRVQPHPVLKQKDLVLIPARFALAMQAAGWYVRSHICWTKKSPMPESVTDRPTSAWESIFLLTKRQRYFYDAEAVRQRSVSDHGSGNGFARPHRASMGGRGQAAPWVPTENGTRNLWNHWLLGAEPSVGVEHYAPYPTEIPRTAIRAGTSERGVCPRCGAPWRRQSSRGFDLERPQTARAMELARDAGLTEEHLEAVRAVGVTDTGKTAATQTGTGKNTAQMIALAAEAKQALGGYYRELLLGKPVTTGWAQGCGCPAHDPVPATVLDVFGGSGTTGVVADQLGRDAVLIELQPDYVQISERRLRAAAPLFAEVSVSGVDGAAG